METPLKAKQAAQLCADLLDSYTDEDTVTWYWRPGGMTLPFKINTPQKRTLGFVIRLERGGEVYVASDYYGMLDTGNAVCLKKCVENALTDLFYREEKRGYPNINENNLLT